MSASCLLLALSCLPLTPRQEGAPSQAQRIDALVSEYVAAQLFSGNVLVARAGEVVFQKSYGLAEREWNVPNDLETKFRIGSLTKQFTAALILLLHHDGKLALEAKLTDFLPWYPRESGERITLHHLLTHTSGLPNYTANPAAIDDFRAHDLAPEELAKKYCTGAPEFEPGTRFVYCNTGYFLLGVVIESVTHQPLARVLRERLLDPLGMKDTGMDDAGALLAKRAAGYSYELDGYENARYLAPGTAYFTAGGMVSTLADLHRWQTALYGEGVLPPDVRELLRTPNLGNYGYGLYVNRVPNSAGTGTTTIEGHNGSLDGFTSSMTRYLEDDLEVILLDNTRCWERANPENLGAGIVAILRGKEPAPPVQSLKVVLTERWKTTSGAALAELYRTCAKDRATYDCAGADVFLNNLGYRLLQDGRGADALALLKCATEEFPARDFLWDSYGEALAKDGQTEAARESFTKALERNPENANARAWLDRLVPKER